MPDDRIKLVIDRSLTEATPAYLLGVIEEMGEDPKYADLIPLLQGLMSSPSLSSDSKTQLDTRLKTAGVNYRSMLSLEPNEIAKVATSLRKMSDLSENTQNRASISPSTRLQILAGHASDLVEILYNNRQPK